MSTAEVLCPEEPAHLAPLHPGGLAGPAGGDGELVAPAVAGQGDHPQARVGETGLRTAIIVLPALRGRGRGSLGWALHEASILTQHIRDVPGVGDPGMVGLDGKATSSLSWGWSNAVL